MIKAKYTAVLKNLLEDEKVKNKIYDIFDRLDVFMPNRENYERNNYIMLVTAERIRDKLLNHYKYREIGFETVGRFIDELKISLDEIMPYYNQLLETFYISMDLESIFDNVDWVSTHTEKIIGSSTGSGSSNSKLTDNTTSQTDMVDNSKMVHSATPQNNLNKSATDIDTVPFADDMQWNKNISSSGQSSNGETSSNSSNTSQNSEERFVEITDSKKGNQGVNTYAHDILKYRETIINIEQQIITDKRIKELFMLVY